MIILFLNFSSLNYAFTICLEKLEISYIYFTMQLKLVSHNLTLFRVISIINKITLYFIINFIIFIVYHNYKVSQKILIFIANKFIFESNIMSVMHCEKGKLFFFPGVSRKKICKDFHAEAKYFSKSNFDNSSLKRIL